MGGQRGFSLCALTDRMPAAGRLRSGRCVEFAHGGRIRGLATMYLDFVVAKGGNAPANEAELKRHMRTIDAIQLNMAGFQRDKIDEAFMSLRDNEPFVVVYGVSVGTIGAENGPLVAYEKTGAGEESPPTSAPGTTTDGKRAAGKVGSQALMA